MVNFIFVAAEIDFLEQNCVRALESSLRTLWRHWLYSREEALYRFSLLFARFFQVYSSCCRYLLVFYLVLTVEPGQEKHIINFRGPPKECRFTKNECYSFNLNSSVYFSNIFSTQLKTLKTSVGTFISLPEAWTRSVIVCSQPGSEIWILTFI